MSVRSHPKKDDGYATLEAERDLSDATAIIQTLVFHRDFVIVDNRMPTDVSHWPAFAFFSTSTDAVWAWCPGHH